MLLNQRDLRRRFGKMISERRTNNSPANDQNGFCRCTCHRIMLLPYYAPAQRISGSVCAGYFAVKLSDRETAIHLTQTPPDKEASA